MSSSALSAAECPANRRKPRFWVALRYTASIDYDPGPIDYDSGQIDYDLAPIGYDSGPIDYDLGPIDYDSGPIGPNS